MDVDRGILEGLGIVPESAERIEIHKRLGGARILKTDHEQHLVTGVVLEPEVEDAQGDVIEAIEIEKTAHVFLRDVARGQAVVGVDHEAEAEGARVVESFIAPADLEIGDQTVRKGSWIATFHVPDAALWKSVTSGERTGFSIGGSGNRESM